MACTTEELQAAVASPDFAYARAGTGLYRGGTLIYHTNPASPTGVHLAAAGDSTIVDPMIRRRHNTSPVSPTERVR